MNAIAVIGIVAGIGVVAYISKKSRASVSPLTTNSGVAGGYLGSDPANPPIMSPDDSNTIDQSNPVYGQSVTTVVRNNGKVKMVHR